MLPSAALDPDVSLNVHDIVNSLELAARLAAGVARELEINVAEARQQFSRLVVLLDRLQMDVTAGGTADAVVASNLEALQKQARDMESDSPPGTIADDAAGGTTKRKKRT